MLRKLMILAVSEWCNPAQSGLTNPNTSTSGIRDIKLMNHLSECN